MGWLRSRYEDQASLHFNWKISAERTNWGIYSSVEILYQSRLKGLNLDEWNFMSYAAQCVMDTSRLVLVSKTTAD